MQLTTTRRLGRDSGGSVRYGETLLPRHFTAAFDFEEAHGLTFEISIDTDRDDPRVVVDSVLVTRHEDLESIEAAELRDLSKQMGWMLEAACQSAAMVRRSSPDRWVPPAADDDVAIPAVRRRRRITPDFLQAVASVVSSAREQRYPETQAVAERFGVSDSQASRYIARAARDGFVQPREATR